MRLLGSITLKILMNEIGRILLNKLDGIKETKECGDREVLLEFLILLVKVGQKVEPKL